LLGSRTESISGFFPTPQLPAADYDQAISAIRAKGYDPSKLVLTPQLP